MVTKKENFTDEDVEAVWEKGTKVAGYQDNSRKDACGAWIKRSMYGNRDSRTNLGWEIDHIDPDGGNDISNLRPLQWYNNVSKSDKNLTCPITASGNKNIEKKKVS